MPLKLSKKIRDQRLKKVNFVMLDEYKNNSTKAYFQCLRCNHKIKSTYSRISIKHTMCRCFRYEMVYKKWVLKIKKRGGEILTPFYIGNRSTKYLFKCENGHQWHSTPASVVEQNSWCNECRGYKERTIEELKKVVAERGGTLLTKEYLGSESSYEFKCNLGHYFSNRFRHVVDRGQWCGICSKGSKSEEMSRTAMEQIFQDEFIKVRPKWLKNNRKKQMELDGFSKKLNIAFEYQGIQHFDKSGFVFDKSLPTSSLEKKLKQRIEDDRTKAYLCKKHQVKLFILTYKDEPEQFLNIIKKQATDFKIDTKKYNFKSPIDFSTAYIRDDRLDDLKTLLLKKKIKVLSKKWISVDSKYKLECSVCDYKWSAPGKAFFNSRSVAGCRKCADKYIANKNKLGMVAIKKYAKKFGGKVLSTEYIRSNHNYEFICKNGHKFKKRFNNMVFRKHFCTICK